MGFEEEAIEEELWQAVMNLACTEEHLCETILRMMEDEGNKEEILKRLMELGDIRKQRKYLINEIIELRKSGVDEKQEEFRTGSGELWCSIKHILMVKMHLFETVQKFIVLYEKTGDKVWMEKSIRLMGLARDLHEYFLDTVDTIFPRKVES